MSDSGPGSDPPPDGPPSGSADDPEATSAPEAADAQAHLRIIPPDPVPEGGGPKSEPEPPVEVARKPGAPRVRVFADTEDPALLPLPAMGPGSGGSRIDSEEAESAGAGAPERRQDTGTAASAAPDEAADGVDASAADDDEAGADDAAEVVEAEAVDHDAAPAVTPAGVADAYPEEPKTSFGIGADGEEGGFVEEDATATQTMEQAAPPAGDAPDGSGAAASVAAPAIGVPGVRLDRSDTGEIIKVSPDSVQRGGDGAATVAADPAGARAGDGDGAPAPAGAGTPAPATFSQRPSPLVKVVTGLAFGFVAIVVILLGRPAFAALAGILIVWVAVEYYGALYQSVADGEQDLAQVPEGTAGHEAAGERASPGLSGLTRRPAAILGVAAVVALAATSYFYGFEATGAVAAAALLAVLVWFVPGATGPVAPRDAALSALGIVHVGVGGSFALLTLRLEHGFALLLVVIILTVVSDVAAYAWGATLGRTPFFNSVSPNKSLEGFVGAVATTIVAGFVIVGLHGWLYPSVPVLAGWGQMLLFATLVAVFATAGDLAESLFKRELGIKDVASFLPGHGGMFDRLDGMVFALPVAYLFLRTMGLADVG